MIRDLYSSQHRTKLEDSEYELEFDENEIENHPAFVQLFNTPTGISELWWKNDNFAGFVIEIDNVGYEFAREVRD